MAPIILVLLFILFLKDHEYNLETILTLAISVSFVALISLALAITSFSLCRKFQNNQYRPQSLWQYERINLVDNLEDDLEESEQE